MDWVQLWDICTQPDNVPIIILLILVPFYTWYALRQGFANDRLIAALEQNPELAKTHHRKTYPYQEGWPQLVHVWPHLLKIEFFAAIVVLTFLIVWSLVLQAPLEEPANPNLTMNPAKAPWYFLGLQEMLVYFDPWIAGVVLPGIILGGLMAIPFCDVNPLGNGYYTFRQRKYALLLFFFGFQGLWLCMSFVGVFIRGPGWMPFMLGQTWDPHRVVDESYRHLYQVAGLPNGPVSIAFGVGVLLAFGGVVSTIAHVLYTRYKPLEYKAMNIFQYATMHAMLVPMMALPMKMILWHVFKIKYVLVTPWFNV